MAGLVRRADDGVTRVQHPRGRVWRRLAIARPGARQGQSLVEFTLVVPLFLILIMAIFGFGLIFQNKVALDNAVRDGARYASTQPDQLTNTTTYPAPENTVQGHIQNAGSISPIPNDDSHISIKYYVVDPVSGSLTQCGYYTVGTYGVSTNLTNPNYYPIYLPQSATQSGTFVAVNNDPGTGLPYTEQGCLYPGRVVTVSATIHYQVPVPIISSIVSAFFPGGVPMQSSTTMTLEQQCLDC